MELRHEVNSGEYKKNWQGDKPLEGEKLTAEQMRSGSPWEVATYLKPLGVDTNQQGGELEGKMGEDNEGGRNKCNHKTSMHPQQFRFQEKTSHIT